MKKNKLNYKMFLKHIDLITPRITLYHQGFLSHSSIISGIISLIAACLIILGAVYYLIEFFGRRNPEAYFFQYFYPESGILPINQDSFLHYISMEVNGTSDSEKGFDFNSFRIIGIKDYLNKYLTTFNKDLTKMDHWIYGPCQESELSLKYKNIVDKNIYKNSACIQKYYSSKDNKYYNINDLNFIWPQLAHGTFNSNNEFYHIILEKCEENTLNEIFGENSHCKNIIDINETVSMGGVVHFNFIDHYVDLFDYDDPIVYYLYKIQTSLEKDNYSTNHLNFIPSILRTSKHIFTDDAEGELSYVYDSNSVFTNLQNGNGIYINYYLWLNNRIKHYERRYKKIQDIIADIGGFGRVITFIASVLNYFYYKYIIIKDTEVLCFSLYNKERDININKSNNIEMKKNDNINLDVNKNNEIEENYNNDPTIVNFTIENANTYMQNINNNIKNQNENLSNLSNQSKEEDSNNTNNTNNLERNSSLNFCHFLCYRLTCRKKYTSFKIYENFRKKVISEEQTMNNYLNIYNLVKKNQSYNSYNRLYTMKDLLNN